MPAFAGDFDEHPEEQFSRPLPPEDRLWRHPSELGSANGSLPLDTVAIRRRWLNQPPTRASAWTAGLVGAILATGLVAIGTHLAGAFTGKPVPSPDASNALMPTATSAVIEPRSAGVGTGLASTITLVGSSVADIDIMAPSGQRHCLGVVVRADGMLVAPAAYVEGASTMTVTLPGSVPEVATVVAADDKSGIAILHVNGATGLTALQLNAGVMGEQSLAVAVTSPGGATYSVGALQGLDSRASVGGASLTDVLRTDLSPSQAPPGSALLGADGSVIGVVAGADNGSAVAVPSWVVGPVVDQLLAEGRVEHGLLGIAGKTVAQQGFSPAGVLLTQVTPGSAAGVAGLRVGDIVTSVNFERVMSMVGLEGHLYGLSAGKQVLIGIERGTTDLFYRVYLQGASR